MRLTEARKKVVAIIEQYAKSRASSPNGMRFVAGRLLINAVVAMQDAHASILEAIQQFKHSPKDRRVLEAASKLGFQRRIAVANDDQKAMAKFEEVVGKTILPALDIALASFEKGDACEKNECRASGCFQVINAGGFDDKIMSLAEREVATAARLITDPRLTRLGFDRICYGEALVTKRIYKANYDAFWLQSEDRIYLRAKTKKGDEALTVGTIIHELGHRLQFVFLSEDALARVQRTYRAWIDRYEASPMVGVEIKKGYRFVDPKRKLEYEVDAVAGDTVLGHIVVEPGERPLTFRAPLSAVAALGGGKKADDPFPSSYARTDDGEMFAELFRVYVLGTATPEQARTFESLLHYNTAPSF